MWAEQWLNIQSSIIWMLSRWKKPLIVLNPLLKTVTPLNSYLVAVQSDYNILGIKYVSYYGEGYLFLKPKRKSALSFLKEIQMKYFITSYLFFITLLCALQTLTCSVSCIFKRCKLYGSNLRSICEKWKFKRQYFVKLNAAMQLQKHLRTADLIIYAQNVQFFALIL